MQSLEQLAGVVRLGEGCVTPALELEPANIVALAS